MILLNGLNAVLVHISLALTQAMLMLFVGSLISVRLIIS